MLGKLDTTYAEGMVVNEIQPKITAGATISIVVGNEPFLASNSVPASMLSLPVK